VARVLQVDEALQRDRRIPGEYICPEYRVHIHYADEICLIAIEIIYESIQM